MAISPATKPIGERMTVILNSKAIVPKPNVLSTIRVTESTVQGAGVWAWVLQQAWEA